MALDEVDIRLGKIDKNNRPILRAMRVANEEIAKLERELAKWKLVRDVLVTKMDE